MQYKTIILELIDSHPPLKHQLASSDSLLSTMNQLASEFRRLHLHLGNIMVAQQPLLSPVEIQLQAMEFATEQMTQLIEAMEQRVTTEHDSDNGPLQPARNDA
ncbi:MAG: hypothetical protein R3E01_36210 [Pirellulaceae bacterium]|nr:hypothetical protein [Planctomycetales bacterium]